MFAYFQSRLHEYLSFAGITDSRFDPAELAFCLEGMLLVREYGVQRSVFDRVMFILRQVQDKNGYWSNTTPMLYQQKGDVLFTVSVEAANAILTSFALQDGMRRIHGSAASDHIDLAKRFWQWVESRRAQVRIGTLELSGWHSEHVNDPNLVHLWETSQILEFLVNFRDQLIRHVARTSLRLAACSYRLPAKPKPVEAPTDPTPESRWEAASKTYEPVTSLGPDYKIFEQIGKLFVAPRFNPAGKPDYSMLLYGPPGTGKTTLASSLSWALDYPLITISVSDFLADGHAAIEARAKHLFKMLRAQPRCVVLFDEIDQFMLDRDSEYFRDLDTVFQFLTPGMLTKLADLRDSKSVIFIMATNYAERIDAAIKRQGRIDRHFLLLPADQSRRREFVERIWKSTPIDFDTAAINSVFLGYSDMESISPQRVDPADAVERLEALPRAARPTMYLSRFYDKQGKPISEVRRTPAEELFAMLALEAEAKGKALRRSEVQAYIAAFLDERFGLDNWPEGLREELNSKRFRIGSV
jgi:ATPase family associated with various cellular activities (AAA)